MISLLFLIIPFIKDTSWKGYIKEEDKYYYRHIDTISIICLDIIIFYINLYILVCNVNFTNNQIMHYMQQSFYIVPVALGILVLSSIISSVYYDYICKGHTGKGILIGCMIVAACIVLFIIRNYCRNGMYITIGSVLMLCTIAVLADKKKRTRKDNAIILSIITLYSLIVFIIIPSIPLQNKSWYIMGSSLLLAVLLGWRFIAQRNNN